MEDLKNMLKETLEFYREKERTITAALASLPKGRIRKKRINGEIYYYLQSRKEGKVVDEYIGKELPEGLIKALEKRKKLEAELKKVRESIKMLGEKHSPEVTLIQPVKDLLKKFTEHGLWDEGLEIVGTWCFILYQRYLRLPHYPLRTKDIDILIPLPYKGKDVDIFQSLKELGFSENFYPDGSMFFVSPSIKIEFLAPERGKEKPKPSYINSLGLTPQLLRFMDILLRENIILTIDKGIKVRVPAPSAFSLHKLLVAMRRREKGKSEKDIKQAVYTGKYILQNQKERKKLLSLWESFPRSWKNRVKSSLKEAMDMFPMEELSIKALEELLK